MINAGGLIKLHHHKNFALLELFSDVNNVLYYRNASLFNNIQLSQNQNNLLTKANDGLYVNGTFLKRFTYNSGNLYFDGKIVSREYEDSAIRSSIVTIWNNLEFHRIGKLDLSYFLNVLVDNNEEYKCENGSDIIMSIHITNQEDSTLKIKIDDNPTEETDEHDIYFELDSLSVISIKPKYDNQAFSVIVEAI